MQQLAGAGHDGRGGSWVACLPVLAGADEEDFALVIVLLLFLLGLCAGSTIQIGNPDVGYHSLDKQIYK